MSRPRGIALALALLVVVALGASAGIASGSSTYCDPLHGCTHPLNVSPGKVKAGNRVRLHGTAKGCKKSQVTIYSRAFKGAARHSFAGVPAVFVRTNKHGSFSTNLRIKRSTKHGKYHVGGRCGGGNFGSATLRVF